MKSFNELKQKIEEATSWQDTSHLVAKSSKAQQAKYFQKFPERKEFFQKKHPDMAHFDTSVKQSGMGPKVDPAKKAADAKISASAYGATRGLPTGDSSHVMHTPAPKPAAKPTPTTSATKPAVKSTPATTTKPTTPATSKADRLATIAAKFSSSQKQKDIQRDFKRRMTGAVPIQSHGGYEDRYDVPNPGFHRYSEEVEYVQEGKMKELDTKRKEEERLKDKKVDEASMVGMPFTAAEKKRMADAAEADKKHKEEQEKREMKEEANQLEENKFSYHMKLATKADVKGDNEKKNYHMEKARSARLGMSSADIVKHKDLLAKYKTMKEEAEQIEEGEWSDFANKEAGKKKTWSDFANKIGRDRSSVRGKAVTNKVTKQLEKMHGSDNVQRVKEDLDRVVPKEGTPVKVIGNVEHSGRKGRVVSSNKDGTFHVVQIGDKTHSFHGSNIQRVKEEVEQVDEASAQAKMNKMHKNLEAQHAGKVATWKDPEVLKAAKVKNPKKNLSQLYKQIGRKAWQQ